ncbi:MAG: polysaccharide biosynthesis C-terminal domain-containing protein [Bacteroidales bacterium]|jgi:O-antigen/teichoic acid export membrane protein|nr:polysaccharide biosynthesis C-terminal domain-containing protein [Bacteroidales bacterium]
MGNRREYNKIAKWNFIFYLLNLLYGVCTGIFLVPLYLSCIQKDLYGYWLATGNILNWITLVNPGFADVLMQRVAYNYGRNRMDLVGKFSFWGLLLTVIVSFLVFLAGIILYFFLHRLFPEIKPLDLAELKNAFLLTLIGTVIMLIYFSLGAIDYGLLSSKTIGLIGVTGNYFSLIAVILLIKQKGLIALGIASIVRSCIYFGGSIVYTFIRFKNESIKLIFDMNIVKDFFSLSLFNSLGKTGSIVMNNSISFICTKMNSPAQTVLLKMSQSGPELGKMFILRILYSFIPVISKLHGESIGDGIKRYISRIYFIIMCFLFPTLFGFYFFNERFIKLWLGDNYLIGNYINILVVILLLFSTMSKLLYQTLFSLGDIKRINLLVSIQSAIYIALAFLLTKYYGIAGALLAGIFCEFVIVIFFYSDRLNIILRYNRLDINKGIKEICLMGISTVFACIFISYTISNFGVNKWKIFFLQVMMFVLVYFGLLFFLSKKFRNILTLLFEKIIWN